MAYKIHEFSKITGLTPYTLRFYEKEGLITVKRDQNNIRIYDDRNKEWIDFFMHLKKTGMTIEDLKQYLVWWYEGDSTNQNRLDLLKKQKEIALSEMKQLQEGISVLDHKIDIYTKKVNDGQENSKKDDA
ncbi:transcriptional regulator [Enterococcus silesiacus]|nr:MerR family transcriptional regulator [Enterococcus silesiacus]ALS01354.1 transcriptional regulator [Enterococcus silesiacus]